MSLYSSFYVGSKFILKLIILMPKIKRVLIRGGGGGRTSDLS